MTRRQLEHIRAASHHAKDNELVIIGSQSILGMYPAAPAAVLRSNEADVFAKNNSEGGELIDGGMGESSPFHQLYGYYAQGVDSTTATVPAGWEQRLIPIRNANTDDATGWCLEPHDLFVSKLVAWREKDQEFLAEALRHELLSIDVLRERLSRTAFASKGLTEDELQRRIRQVITGSIQPPNQA